MSKETKHTPGPWREIHSVKGENLHLWILAKDEPGSKRELQILQVHDCHPIKEHLERRLADFKLMTASPEMYAILDEIFTNDGMMPNTLGKINQLFNKINKP